MPSSGNGQRKRRCGSEWLQGTCVFLNAKDVTDECAAREEARDTNFPALRHPGREIIQAVLWLLTACRSLPRSSLCSLAAQLARTEEAAKRILTRTDPSARGGVAQRLLDAERELARAQAELAELGAALARQAGQPGGTAMPVCVQAPWVRLQRCNSCQASLLSHLAIPSSCSFPLCCCAIQWGTGRSGEPLADRASCAPQRTPSAAGPSS